METEIVILECKKCGILMLQQIKMKNHVYNCRKGEYSPEFESLYKYVNQSTIVQIS